MKRMAQKELISSSKSLYTSRSTRELFKKVLVQQGLTFECESGDEPLQYSLVPTKLDNQSTPNFNFGKTDVQAAYFDQPNYESFDQNQETSSVQFSERGRQIAFKRRNSQEKPQNQHKANSPPKVDDGPKPNHPNEQLYLRKAKKIQQDVQQQQTPSLLRSSSMGVSLSEMLISSRNSPQKSLVPNDSLYTPVLKLKEENRLKAILRSSELRRRLLTKQQEKAAKYMPVEFDQVAFKFLF